MVIQPPDYASYVAGSRCGWCGTKFAEQKIYPRICFHCGNTTYKNPTPVVVTVVPVPAPGCSIYNRKNPARWLVQQRNINPKKGEWALPGGYINYGETWEQAAARELEEEVGLVTKPSDYSLLEVVNATNDNMLIFCTHNDGVKEEDIHFIPNDEVVAVQLITDPYQIELCFPTHNEQLRKYYDSLDW